MKRNDLGIKRAASVIMWHLWRDHTEGEAVARAAKREPDLSESELTTALQWARDCLAFTDALSLALEISENGCSLCNELPPPGECPSCAEQDLGELAKKFGLPRS